MKKTIKFYSEQEINEMKDALELTSTSIKSLAKEFSKRFDRTPLAVEQKMVSLAKNLTRPENTIRHLLGTKLKNGNIRMKYSVVFYSQQELGEMIHALSMSSESVSKIARRLSIKYNRTEKALIVKLCKLAKGIVRPAPEEKVKKSQYVKKEKAQKSAKITVQKVTVPQTLGIDVPEGTSFDIQNVKRVVLQQKSLTIYF